MSENFLIGRKCRAAHFVILYSITPAWRNSKGNKTSSFQPTTSSVLPGTCEATRTHTRQITFRASKTCAPLADQSRMNALHCNILRVTVSPERNTIGPTSLADALRSTLNDIYIYTIIRVLHNNPIAAPYSVSVKCFTCAWSIDGLTQSSKYYYCRIVFINRKAANQGIH